MPRPKTNAREKILAIADGLFYREGIRATGIDKIIAQSEVAKTTFYRYFPSKDDLVVAYLESRDQQFWVLLEAAIAHYPSQPKQQLLTIMGWLDELLNHPNSQGCPFLIVASEFPNLDYPGHQLAIAHKQKLRNQLASLANDARIESAQALGDVLMLLIDGAFAQRRLYQAHRVPLLGDAERLVQSYEQLSKSNPSKY